MKLVLAEIFQPLTVKGWGSLYSRGGLVQARVKCLAEAGVFGITDRLGNYQYRSVRGH
jgi:hypothetical protein